MTSRAKKRIVLPSRPEPPSVEEILEDVRGAVASDPVFVCDLSDDSLISSEEPPNDRDKPYVQSCAYVQMNNKLKEAQVELKQKYEELASSGMKLGKVIEELREAAIEKDADLVMDIVGTLEENGYHGYVEHRDKTAGVFAISAATMIIEESVISFLVLSTQTLQEPWYKRVSEWCLTNVIEKKTARLVPIYVDLQDSQKPDILKFLNGLNYDKYFKNKLLRTMRAAIHR